MGEETGTRAHGPKAKVSAAAWEELRGLLRRRQEGFASAVAEERNLADLMAWMRQYGSALIAQRVSLSETEIKELGTIEKALNLPQDS